MHFVYEAMAAGGATINDRIEALDQAEAVASLRERGLLVLRLEQSREAPRAVVGGLLQRCHARLTGRDLILLTRQMKMLLEAGSPLVPALEATEEQTTKPFVRALLRRLRERVEQGISLSQALETEGPLFDAVFRSMIAAGEATASLPQAFGQLCALAQQQQNTRKLVLGALLYPAILSLLLIGVVAVLLFFVVPRFKMLFTSMKSPMPTLTRILFDLSDFTAHYWPYLAGLVLPALVAAVLCLRLPRMRQWLDEILLRLPLIGRLMGRLIFARVIRIWAAMLRCHVPLLDAIHQSRAAITNTAFLQLIARVEESVSSGGRMAPALASARLADPIIVSAIRTGEDNGRLGEATDFVSTWIDEDNTSAVQHLTRLAEPAMLAVMGVVVGFVAMGLFIPLFDLAGLA